MGGRLARSRSLEQYTLHKPLDGTSISQSVPRSDEGRIIHARRLGSHALAAVDDDRWSRQTLCVAAKEVGGMCGPIPRTFQRSGDRILQPGGDNSCDLRDGRTTTRSARRKTLKKAAVWDD